MKTSADLPKDTDHATTEHAVEYKYTSHIRIAGHGVSEASERFINLTIGTSDHVLVRLDNLSGSERQFFTRLNQMGAHLVNRPAQTELINRIQACPPTGSLFPVATKVGWHNGYFVDPFGSEEQSPVAIYLDALGDLTRKYRVSGSLTEWKKICRLAKGNSRLMMSIALAFVGPLGDILGVEQPGIQLVGPGMSGKTGVAVAAGSVWGCHPDRNVAASRAFGESWNNTLNNLEPVALSHNHTFLILDETRLAKPELVLEAIFRFERSTQKGRLTDQPGTRSWWVPLLSTSNASLDALAAKAGIELDDAYRSRLIDVPLPARCHSIFENLHGHEDHAALTKRLIELATENHGHAACRYLSELQDWRDRDAEGLKRWLQDRRAAYLKMAKKWIISDRDLSRFHGHFATIYAAGCLANEFELLPWKRKWLSEALLACEQAHVELVGRVCHQTKKTSVRPEQRLRNVLHQQLTTFADLRSKASRRAAPSAPIGYVITHKGKTEYLFTEKQFEQIGGAKIEANALKAELARQGHIESTGKGEKLRYAVKRKLPGKSKRSYFIVVRPTFLPSA
jgi:hypothetical protein